MSEQDLRDALSQFGAVVSVRILRDQHKQSRGVGFARMNDREQCQEIINQFHNKTFQSLSSIDSLVRRKQARSLLLDYSDKIVQVKFADASKNKKSYKTGFDVSLF
jgi:RNA recognition motif-containing protein